jgi:stage V sporulation protein G
MEITQIRVFPVHEEKLKAFVSVILDDCFVVSDIKIIQGTSGLFVSMPSKKRKNGTFRDIAHPLNNETRRRFEEQIIARYREVMAETGGEAPAPLRELDDGTDPETSQAEPSGPAPESTDEDSTLP